MEVDTMKMINLKLTEHDLRTLNNILSWVKDDNETYNTDDIITVLNKIKRTAIRNNIELTD